MGQRAKAILFFLVVFISGALTGAALQKLIEHYWLHPQLKLAPLQQKSQRAAMIERFQLELRLSDPQTKQLTGILDRTMRQYDDLHTYTEHIREDGIRQIRDMLDTNQRAHFEEILKEGRKPRDAEKKRRLH